MKHKEILREAGAYYTEKVEKNGLTPKGVDWNSADSQNLRFEILSDVVNGNERFSIIDYGCGYGAMFDYYKEKYKNFNFIGFDISDVMIKKAIERQKNDTNATWFTDWEKVSKADYIISSGIFNVKFKNIDKEWLDYCIETLHLFNEKSTKGFAFNMLTKYSDPPFMKDNLYYADPLYIFDYCKKHFAKHVALRHDYPLYEFTIIVRK